MEWEAQRPSAPSTPSSMSSQSTGNSGPRSEKIPTFKQISPSPSVSALSKLTDDELRRKGIEDMLRIVRRLETDYKSLLGEHGNIIKDVNRRLQIFVLETRGLKEVNQKLQDDNQELRDLCCFLDDDRQRGRKLAREWQRFGRYTASVMRSEVAVYQEKLRELEDRQSELVTENMELKELCLYLDQERVRMTGDRDEGDGSSNGTVTGHEDGIVPMETNGSTTPTPTAPTANSSYPLTSSSAASYIRELELKVHRLEEEKKLLAQRIDRNSAEGLDVNLMPTAEGSNAIPDQLVHGSVPAPVRKSPVASKPEAVVHAMKVLQVHEELEKSPVEEDLDDPAKAIVREMCNVVWRKLGDVGDVGSFNESSDSILDPPFVPESPVTSGIPMATTVGPVMGQAQVHSTNVTQPLPQTASMPFPAPSKPESVSQFPSDHLLTGGPQSHLFHPQRQERHHPLKPPPESHQQHPQPPMQHPHLPQGHMDPGFRSRQESAPERLPAEKDRGLPFKQPLDRPEDRRNPEQNYPPHTLPETQSKPMQHQEPSYHPQHRPLSPQQQQQAPSSSSQQRFFDPSKHPHSSQRPSDLTSGTSSQPKHIQQRPQPHQHAPPSAVPRNQSQPDSVVNSSLPQGGHMYPQRNTSSSANSLPSQGPSQQLIQRGTPAYSSQIRLLDAPGSHRRGGDPGGHQFQRQNPSQVQTTKQDGMKEEPSSARPRSKGDSTYEDRHSSEREIQSRPAPRSLSSSGLNQPNPAVPSQNLPASVSHQNLRGPGSFRAYPPQLTSMPNQPLSWRGGKGQDAPPGSNHYQGDQGPRSATYRNEPTPRPNYSTGAPTHSGRQGQGSRFQEQEWRQTYLDDSDTL